MFNANHIVGHEVYRVRAGNPSGVAITVIINSLVNSLMMRAAYISLGRSNGFSVDTFRDNVSLKVYGDDNIVAVNSCAGWFNAISVSQLLGRYNITYNPDKCDSFGYQPLNQVVYLKRSFVERDGIIWAPLELAVVLESMMWMHKNVGVELNMQETYRNFSTELVHHGRSVFNKYTSIILQQARQKSLRLSTIDFDYIVNKINGQHACDQWISVNPIPDV
jgi:hypothetical protein